MFDYVKKFEHIDTVLVIVIIALVAISALTNPGWLLILYMSPPPLFILEVGNLLEIFGIFLLLFLGPELLETIKWYYLGGRIDPEDTFSVALIVFFGRKIISLRHLTLPNILQT